MHPASGFRRSWRRGPGTKQVSPLTRDTAPPAQAAPALTFSDGSEDEVVGRTLAGGVRVELLKALNFQL